MADLTEKLYIETATGLLERYNRVCAIITALEEQLQNTGAENSDVEEYALDDGQTKIRTLYRSPSQIADAIFKFEKIKEMLLNKLNGRTVALRDWRGLL